MVRCTWSWYYRCSQAILGCAQPAITVPCDTQGSSSLPELRKQPTSQDFCAVVNRSGCESAVDHQGPLTRTRLVSINGDDEAPPPVTLTWADVGCALSTQYQHRQVPLDQTRDPVSDTGLGGSAGGRLCFRLPSTNSCPTWKSLMVLLRVW